MEDYTDYNKKYCKEYYKNNKEYLNAYYRFYYFLNSDEYKQRYNDKNKKNVTKPNLEGRIIEPKDEKIIDSNLGKKYSPRKNKIMRIEKQLRQTAERARIFKEQLNNNI